MEHPMFPYKPRRNQKEILDTIYDAVQKKKHLVLESKTGSGKTICALVPTLQYAQNCGKRVLYLTRTNSQQRQVILELRKISKVSKVYGVGLQGRHSMCPLLMQDSVMAAGSPEELSKVCGKRKAEVLRSAADGSKPAGCGFFANVCRRDLTFFKEWAKDTLPTMEEMIEHATKEGLCPYEINKILVRDALLVSAPYIYFFNKFIRARLFEWMGCVPSDTILIVDEAHNLPDYAREIESVKLGIHTLEQARKEAVEFDDLKTSDGTQITDIVNAMERIILSFKTEYLTEDAEDTFIPPGEFLSELMHHFCTTSVNLKAKASDLVIHGEIIREMRLKEGKLPRSYIHSVGTFLSFWMEQQDENFVKLMHDQHNPTLEMFCLEPAYSTQSVLECHSSLFMSGTLTPLDEFRDTIGLPEDSPKAQFPSPFPPENRVVIYTDDVTSRYEDITRDPEIVENMADYLVNISSSFDKNMGFFFPSFGLMDRFLKNGLHFNLNKKTFIESQGMKQSAVMGLVEAFKTKSKEGSILFSVVGGRLSEGMDYPAEQMEILVVVGIPYPKPSARQRALEIFYDRKFNKGWEYAVKAPTTRRLLQTIGRLIRDEKDRGCAVILDSRAIQFKEYIPDLRLSRNMIFDCARFFEGKPNEV